MENNLTESTQSIITMTIIAFEEIYLGTLEHCLD